MALIQLKNKKIKIFLYPTKRASFSSSQWSQSTQNQLTVTSPILTCSSSANGLVVAASKRFNMTVNIADQVTQLQLPNIAWANYTWAASIQMYSMNKCNSKYGKLMSDNDVTASFDLVSGVATFNNLYITGNGLYLLQINVRTVNTNKYNLNCYTQSIFVTPAVLSTSDCNQTQTLSFTIQGNFTSFTTTQIEVIKAQLYNCFILASNITLKCPIVAYSGSVVVATTQSDSTSTASLVALKTSVQSGFTTDSGNQMTGVSVGGSSAYSSSGTSSSSGSSSSSSSSDSTVIFYNLIIFSSKTTASS
jgi:hypothetical protein